MAEFFAGKDWQTFMQVLPTIPFETWETVWSTVVATLLALVIGLPLGVLLVTGEPNGIRPLPKWVMALLNSQSMGATPLQIITKVMVPESMPSLVANITIAATTIMGYGAMAGIIGGGGLGKIAINYGYYRFNVVLEFFATALLVVLVQILQTAGT